MDKTLRCTVCTWRGTWAEAAATRVQPQPLAPQLEDIQRAYEQKQLEDEQLGGHRQGDPKDSRQLPHRQLRLIPHRHRRAGPGDEPEMTCYPVTNPLESRFCQSRLPQESCR